MERMPIQGDVISLFVCRASLKGADHYILRPHPCELIGERECDGCEGDIVYKVGIIEASKKRYHIPSKVVKKAKGKKSICETCQRFNGPVKTCSINGLWDTKGLQRCHEYKNVNVPAPKKNSMGFHQ